MQYDKKYILITLCLLFICITGCKDTVSDIKNKTINQTETTETSKTTKDNEILESSKKREIKVIYDKDKELKLVNLTKKEKDKLFSDFLKYKKELKGDWVKHFEFILKNDMK